MIKKIPDQTKLLKQYSNTDVFGDIWSSFNLNLSENLGRIRVSPRGMVTSDSTDLINLATPIAFRFYDDGTNERIWCIAGDRMFHTAGINSGTWTQDATSGTPTGLGGDADMQVFNNALYVIGNGTLYKYNGSWTTVSSTPQTINPVSCVYAGRMYFAHNISQIGSVSLSDVVVVASGTPNTVKYTCSLADYGAGGPYSNTITGIASASNKIWIATMDSNSDSKGGSKEARIFEWNGQDAQVTKVYNVDSQGIMALIVDKNDRPFAIDADGRLLAFNGGGFEEIARLPIPKDKFLINPTFSVLEYRFIHPNGMCIKDGHINMLVNNKIHGTGEIIENCPSGIWEYNFDLKTLYHKNSISAWKYNVTTTRTDYAQNRLRTVGALYPLKSLSTSATANSDVLYGIGYHTDSDITSTPTFAVGIIDTLETQEKIGYFVTSKIESSAIQDTWQKVYIKFKKLLDSSDKILLKYRTSEIPAVEGAITWTSTTTFTSTLDLSDFAIGDEVEITMATGSGQIEHITSITDNAGTYTVTLENAVIGATGTSRARFQKWIKISTAVTDQTIDFKEFSLGLLKSNWIQFKCVMYFKGKDELNELGIVSVEHKPA